MTDKTTLYLIDGSSYLYRAYHAIRHLSGPGGFPTNAIFGFTQMLLKVLKDRQPSYVAVVFDISRKTFRTEIYPEYKANRAAMPDDLRQQVEPIKELVRAFRIPVLELDGYEADDIIGTICRDCGERGIDTVVVTGDKDLMQVVGDHATLLDTMKDKVSGPAEVVERFGVGPDKVIDILGLAGDSSDNIPGVPGIGEKTAIKLVQEFGSMDALLARADEVKGKTGENLRAFADQARLSRQLATIDCHVPIAYDLGDFVAEPPDNTVLAGLFKRFGFTSLMKELTSRSTLSTEEYRTILTEAEFTAMLQELEKAEEFAIDLETTSLDARIAEIVGISLSWRMHEAYYIPVGHHYLGVPPQLERATVLNRLRPLLTDPAIRKIGQNIKYDYQVLRTAGVEMHGVWFDTMLAAYLVNPGRTSQGLDALSVEYLDHKMISYEEVAGKGKDQKRFDEIEVEKAARYSCEDSDATYMLHRLLLPKVAVAGMESLLFELEMPLVTILAEMELLGVRLDLPFLAELSAGLGKQLATLESRIHELAGGPFNVNSPKQLGEILFEKLQLPTGKKTKLKTGWSTNVDELERLAEAGHEIATLLLQQRGLTKLKSTYTDALPQLADSDGRVHTSYNQAVTSTGRLSSSDPNLQNIPIRTEEGKKIRQAFIAREGCKILSADYSQIELRVLAHLSGDPVFCDAFVNDEDIHTRTAAEVFDLLPGLVTAEMRRQAKTINFGVIYGQSAFSLAAQLGVARKVAEDFIATYKARHAGAMAFLDSCIQLAREHGYVTTMLGRRLPIPDINSHNFQVRSFAERNAINYPIQGSAADIIKKAMINIDRRLKLEGAESRLIMQVHDELVFEVPEGELIHLEQLVEHEMAHAVECRVPLKVDISYGSNWAEAH
ncbi:DNA polymerase I [Geobacter sp. OR-1]|uniref:DNA polymerase I n=1 Tax=Geobacter sp. OR-1 TaxID=1266765 RepID=UPI000541ABBB|nr:DNA polymerase I [Geobacter sp. OR-1]GAM09818.1 DNA polymerase I [Geobacter sp. OR-1]